MFSEITDMLVFAAVARAGSLTRAGHTLKLPKSTISRRVAALEERIGSRLLHKTTRRLVLTEAGEAFLERCQRLADEADRALTFAGELSSEPRGTLRMTMPPNIGDPRLYAALSEFSQRHSGITLELDESARFIDLGAERYDLALRGGGVLSDSSLVARRLCDLESGVFASPDYLARHSAPRTPSDLARHHFSVLEGRTRFDHFELKSGAERAHVVLPSRITTTTSGMQLRLALSGVAAIVYPIIDVSSELEAGRLQRLLPQWTTHSGTLWIVTPSRRLLARKTVLLIEHLLVRFADPA